MKRIFVIVLMAWTVTIAFAAGQSDIDSGVVRYGGQYYPGEFLLQGQDFFSPFDVQVEHTLFSSGTENNEALISGNIDVNVGSDSKSVALFNAIGDQAVIIGTVQRGDRYSTLVRPDSDYTDWADLKGRTVGTRFGSGAEFVLRKYFDSRSDVSWDDFNWINLKTEDMIAALDNGQIESFTVWAPTGEIAESQGIGRVIKSFGDVALTPVMIHTTRRFIETNREELVRFVAGHLEKANMIEEDPDRAAQIAAQAASERNLNIDVDAFELIFQRINFQIDFEPSLMDELQQTAQFLESQGQIDSIPSFHYDLSILEDAYSLLNDQN